MHWLYGGIVIAGAALYALGLAFRELERQGWIAPPAAPDASHAENPPGA